MGDGSVRPIAKVNVGSEIYGTTRKGAYRRYVKTKVLAHWSVIKPAYRVSLEDGTEIVAGADHRFLTERGWKFVRGAMGGELQRPYLTENNKLIGTGKFAEEVDKDSDYKRGYLCGMVAQLSEQMDDSQFRQRVSSVIEQVIKTYWRLALAIANYETQRKSWDVAVAEYEQTRKQNQDGHDNGTLLSQRAEVASHDQSVAQASVQIIQAGNALRRLLAASVMDPVWSEGLITSDRPDFRDPALNLNEAVKTAFDRRPELEQLRLQIKQSDAEVRFDRQETKPSVNLRLEALSTGDAGTVMDVPAGSAVPPSGGLGTSYRQALVFQHPSLAAGLDIKLPLRNSAAKSQLVNALIGTRKLETQLRATQEDILVDVRNAWESIAARRRDVEAAGASRKFAEERLAGQPPNPDDSQRLDILRDQKERGGGPDPGTSGAGRLPAFLASRWRKP